MTLIDVSGVILRKNGWMSKVYKRTIYWLCMKNFCGQIAVDQDGKIYGPDSASYLKFAYGQSFSLFISKMKNKKQIISLKKIDVEEDAF